MTKFSSPDVIFKFDVSDGGSLTDITTYITKIGDINITRPLVESTPFGTSTAEWLVSIFKKYEPITIGGFFDDTATSGPDAVFNIGRYVHAVTRSFEITLGTRKLSGDAWIVSYKRTFTSGEYTQWEAEIQITGTVTEATV